MATKKPTTKKKDTARQLAIAAARLIADDKCDDIIVLDLKDRSPVTDYFVIATGTSDRQMRSAATNLANWGKKNDNAPWHVAGIDSADWVVLDFVDVVVHIFNESHRRYYDLELIWGEAPRVRWQRVTRKKKEEPTEE